MIETGHLGHMGGERSAYRNVVGKSDGQRPLGLHSHRWEYNIETDIQNLVWVLDWIDLAQERKRQRVLVNAVMNFRVSLNKVSFLTS